MFRYFGSEELRGPCTASVPTDAVLTILYKSFSSAGRYKRGSALEMPPLEAGSLLLNWLLAGCPAPLRSVAAGVRLFSIDVKVLFCSPGASRL